jgi:hypothetical protein
LRERERERYAAREKTFYKHDNVFIPFEKGERSLTCHHVAASLVAEDALKMPLSNVKGVPPLQRPAFDVCNLA